MIENVKLRQTVQLVEAHLTLQFCRQKYDPVVNQKMSWSNPIENFEQTAVQLTKIHRIKIDRRFAISLLSDVEEAYSNGSLLNPISSIYDVWEAAEGLLFARQMRMKIVLLVLNWASELETITAMLAGKWVLERYPRVLERFSKRFRRVPERY